MPVPPALRPRAPSNPDGSASSVEPVRKVSSGVSGAADTFSRAEDTPPGLLLSRAVTIRDLVRWGDERLLAGNEEVREPDGDLGRLIDDIVRDLSRGAGRRARRAPDRRQPPRGRHRPLRGRGPVRGHRPGEPGRLDPRRASRRRRKAACRFPTSREGASGPAGVVVSAATRASGAVREIEGTGLLARALCHETDHLNGLLFVDRLRGLKRELTWRKIERRHARGAVVSDEAPQHAGPAGRRLLADRGGARPPLHVRTDGLQRRAHRQPADVRLRGRAAADAQARRASG